jgi:hypothetical protein
MLIQKTTAMETPTYSTRIGFFSGSKNSCRLAARKRRLLPDMLRISGGGRSVEIKVNKQIFAEKPKIHHPKPTL